jgi:hypothetical protein
MIGIGKSLFKSNVKVASGGGGTDPDAQAFITAAGITNPTQQSAVNQFVLDLKSAKIWTKMKAIYPIVGGTASTHKWNLKNPLDTDAAFRLTFSTGWTHSSTGMVGNGTSAYANTNLMPNTALSLSTAHVSYYSRTNVAADDVEMGCSITASEQPIIYLTTRYSSNQQLIGIGNASGTSFISTTETDSRGLFIASRTSLSSLKLYKNNTIKATATGTTTMTQLPTVALYLAAYNYYVGTPSGYSGKECAFASIGDGLTDTEAANLYTAVQNYQTTLARQV